jgi:tripartite-type tricarboxylate transporter receptor subunit TctC
MHNAMATALKNPEFVERLRQSDQEVIGAAPAETAARLAADSEKWGAVARRIQLRLE